MIKRNLTHQIKDRFTKSPAVLIVGPRQVGKTTLAKSLGGKYFDLEKDADKIKLDLEWQRLIKGNDLLILDEAQMMPEVFGWLRSAIDENRSKNGRFLLLGSVSPVLMKEVGESLTGRLSICELSPFSITELKEQSQDLLWKTGGYPDGGILTRDHFPIWQSDYLELLAQRDFPEWGLPARPSLTKRLFHMLAATNGQNWNASQIGKSLGINYHSANDYTDFLENVFLIRRLLPFAANLKKRLVKSPKLYWRDSGLLHSLLGVRFESDLLIQPWIGYSWEGWVIEQTLTYLKTSDKAHRAYYLRTSDRHEIDLVLELDNRLCAIEIKLTSLPKLSDLDRLEKTAELIKADYCVLISRTEQSFEDKKKASLNIKSFFTWLDEN